MPSKGFAWNICKNNGFETIGFIFQSAFPISSESPLKGLPHRRLTIFLMAPRNIKRRYKSVQGLRHCKLQKVFQGLMRLCKAMKSLVSLIIISCLCPGHMRVPGIAKPSPPPNPPPPRSQKTFGKPFKNIHWGSSLWNFDGGEFREQQQTTISNKASIRPSTSLC